MKRWILLVVVLAVASMVLAACPKPTPQVVEKTVVVTKEVEKVVTKEVQKVVTQVVTKEVEKVVTKVVTKEVEPAKGRCAPTSLDELGDKGVIKIGVPIPLSAPGSVTGGQAMQIAANIAVNHINENGGILGKYPIDVVFYDTSGLPERGRAGAEYLITQECVAAIAGEYHSAAGVQEKEVAHKYGVLAVFAETWNDKITAAQYPEVFRIAPASSMVAQADAKFFSDLGTKWVAIVAENTDYGVPASKATKKRLADLGIDSEIYLAEQGTQDFSALVSRIVQDVQQREGRKGVLVLITGETSYNFEQQAVEGGLAPAEDLVFVANQVAANHSEFWANVPDGNYMAFRRVGVVPALTKNNPVAQRFIEDYKKMTRDPDRFPESYAFEQYDALMLVAHAIEQAKSLKTEDLIAALEALDSKDHGFQGAQGIYYFLYGTKNPVPDDVPAWMWHQWPDPAILFLQYWKEGQTVDDACVIWPEHYRTCGTDYIVPGTEPPMKP